MDKVTYIVGAGFSAPIGLPVMSNFLFKSRDIYFADKERYKYFSDVFDSIRKLSVIKNYYQADLFNIEEILSITEMVSFLDGEKLKDDLKKYIIDVIDYYTPKVKPYSDTPNGMPGNWQDFIFGKSGAYSNLCYLIGHMLRARFEQKEGGKADSRVFYAMKDETINTRYSILSLNYDLVFENVVDFISTQYLSDNPIKFNKDSYDSSWDDVHLMKLHGCVKSGLIVPPTWAKGTPPRYCAYLEKRIQYFKGKQSY